MTEPVDIHAGMSDRTLQTLARWAGLDETPFAALIYRDRLNDLDKVIIVQELADRGFRMAQVDDYIRGIRG